MCTGRSPIAFGESEPQEPWLMIDQKDVLFSAAPVVSYRSGRPRSWPNSCAKTPTPPFSASIV
jgi:hypothetical protein